MPDSPFSSTLSLAAHPEPNQTTHNRFDETVATLLGKLHIRRGRHEVNFKRFYRQIKKHLRSLKVMDDTEYTEHITRLHYAMARDGLTEEHITQSFALVYRTILRELGMRPYKVQLVGAWVMMQGMLAEMASGEGKTLTASFPACTAALAKIPVHVITANDYLAARDARLMQPVYQSLGLSVGVVTSAMPEDERHAAYACHITYCTAKQLAHDYLHDRLQDNPHQRPLQPTGETRSPAPRPFLRGLCYAIVDEADSVLLDETGVPLMRVNEQADEKGLAAYYQALATARLLDQGRDFHLSPDKSKVRLTPRGQQRLSELTAELSINESTAQTRQRVLLALRVLHVIQQDKHYLVKDQAIQRIDKHTGRPLTEQDWGPALKQMIECKQECAAIKEDAVLARISLQGFFRRYLHLAGMTGTAREATGELRRIYGLDLVTIPTRKPCRRKMLPERIYPHAATKWLAGVKRIEKIHNKGRPVLVGTRSINDSKYLSLLLTKAQLPHQLLYGRQDEDEAKTIARAGKSGQITIVTDMAGRGTDIRLLRESKKAGGLHVISMELNDTRRLDRQLYERCGRQGNWGSAEAIVSLDDPLFEQLPSPLRRILQRGWPAHRYLPLRLSRSLIRLAQWLAQRHHLRCRRRLLEWDSQ